MLAKENDVLDKNLQRNNEMQLKATKKALSSRFTLIQGPPGTCLLKHNDQTLSCLLYTSDAADDMQCVDLGGRRIIKK